MKLLTAVICLFVLPLFQTCYIENGWKGIKVFQSNRTDVEKLFGKPADTNVTVRYDTDDFLIHVTYSASPCSNDGDGRFNVPEDTVIEYYVVLKNMLLKNLKWKKELYESSPDYHLKKLTHYYNRENEIRVVTFKTSEEPTVSEISYGRADVKKFICKGSDSGQN
jgi:hypothetical protein